ncbi:MAG TPA: hypothetical protein VNO81_11805 [Candidatus Nitrosotenuis sp.]|jgi:hypothetical protein|nr:hypothetical protein [Candidatus Nitrosotenuis sp.]
MQVHRIPPSSFTTPSGIQIHYAGAAVAVPGKGSAGAVGITADLNGDGAPDRGGAAFWKYNPQTGGTLTLVNLEGETRSRHLPPRPVRPV